MIKTIIAKFRREGLWKTLTAILMRPFTARKRKVFQDILRLETPKERFNEIYEKKIWLGGESVSGEGSEIAYTGPMREWLLNVIPKLQIKRFVDAPCGDFNWMRLVKSHVDMDYVGYDIVEKLIISNNERYKDSSTSFFVADICSDKIADCDLLMVRDCLFHLSYHDINRFLHNIKKFDYKYLLTTTHLVGDGFSNSDIVTGDARHIDLFRRPFSFKESAVIDRVYDYPPGYPMRREMILVAKADVPLQLDHIE